jgi:histidyl-tRNA synthetase
VEEIGGTPTPATGFAVGLERIVALMQTQEDAPTARPPHAYLLAVGDEAERAAHGLAEQLRDALPGLRLLVDAGPGNFKRKMKSADRSLAELALILGEDEVRERQITCKNMRDHGGQLTVARAQIVDTVKARINFDD